MSPKIICPHGISPKRKCNECRKAWKKADRHKNADKIKNQKHESYLRHRDSILQKSKQYRLDNLEIKREYDHTHYMNTKDTTRKEYIEKSRDRIRAYDRERAHNPNRATWIKKYNRMQMERRRSGIKLHSSVFDNLIELFGGRCAYCFKKVDNLTLDHMIPLSKGGTGHEVNVLPACSSCNKRKAAKTNYITVSMATKILNILGVSYAK